MFRREQAESNKTKASLIQSVKRYQYQSIISKSTNEPTPTIQLPGNHGGDDEVTFMVLI